MVKRLTSQQAEGKRISFEKGETVHVGFDVHKKDYHATMWSERREAVVTQWVQPADPTAVIAALRPYKDRVTRIVYEAGPTGYGLARALRGAGFVADVIAPSRTPTASGQEAKSDRLDSRKLAMWSAKGLLQAVRVPTCEEEGDRQMFRIRDQIVAKRRRVKQQIKSFLLQHGIAQPEGLKNWSRKGVAALRALPLSAQLRFALDLLLDDLAHYDRQRDKADNAIAALARTTRHKRSADALRTVPGVGPVTAMAVRTELIAPERFGDGREVAAMAGLAPLVMRTGQTVRQGPLMKCGNARLRKALIEAAWRWVAQDPWARQRYHELSHNTGEKKKAIAAMARRLGIILWRISVTGEAYRPRPCPHPDRATPGETAQPRQPGLPSKNKPTDPNRTSADRPKAERRRRTNGAPCPYSHRGSRPAPRRECA